VTYDPRGAGASTGGPPYDIETDTADLAALLEAVGGDAVGFSVQTGTHAAMRVAVERPDLLRAVVSAGPPLGSGDLRDAPGFAASPAVVDLMFEQSRRDPRGALRAMIASVNPGIADDELRRRVDEQLAYVPGEVMLARAAAWLADDPVSVARVLGDRLWVLVSPDNQWVPEEAIPKIAEVLPEAQVERLPAGALTEPGQSAEVIRRAGAAS